MGMKETDEVELLHEKGPHIVPNRLPHFVLKGTALDVLPSGFCTEGHLHAKRRCTRER